MRRKDKGDLQQLTSYSDVAGLGPGDMIDEDETMSTKKTAPPKPGDATTAARAALDRLLPLVSRPAAGKEDVWQRHRAQQDRDYGTVKDVLDRLDALEPLAYWADRWLDWHIVPKINSETRLAKIEGEMIDAIKALRKR